MFLLRKKTKTAILLCLVIVISISHSLIIFADSDKNESGTETLISELRLQLSNTSEDKIIAVIKDFADIENHWSREYVGKLNLLEIIAGYGDGRFGPEDTLKVDEFLKMTLRAMGHKVEEGTTYWAEPYIELAKEEKVIDENEFTDYRRAILREEAARIIVKAALKTEEAPIPNHTSYAKLRIPDYANIGDTYKQHVLYSYSLGLINGVADGSFLPKKTLTRGEGSAIVMRYLDKGMRNPMRPKGSEIVTITNELYNKTYEIYPLSKPEVMDVIRVMKESTPKSKGYSELAYNPAEELIFSRFYTSKEAYEESTIFSDCCFSIRMAEWELGGYSLVVFEPNAVKELHREVIVDLFNHLFENEAEKVIKDFEHCLELGIKGGQEYQKEYRLNNRRVVISKHQGDNGFSIGIGLQN